MLCMGAPFLISWLLISFATNYTMLLAAVFIQGCAVGMCLCLITYTTEICSTKYRGIMLSLVVVFFNLGSITCSTLMYFFKWNVVSLIFSGFSVCSFFVVFLPESPIWLYSKGHAEKATRVLRSVRNATPREIANEAREIRESFARKDVEEKISVTGVARNCVNSWRQMAVLMGYTVIMMHAGHYILVCYTVLIVDSLRIPFDSVHLALYYTIVGILGSFSCPFFFHSFNRKPTLAISTFGMGVSMAVIGVYEEMFLYEENKPCAWLVSVALFAFAALSNVAIFPLGFVIGGEILPAEGRGILFGIGSCFTSIYYTLTLKYYPQVLFVFGVKALVWSFAVNCFVVSLFAVFVLPETRGKTLNQVQEQYFGGKRMKKENVPLNNVGSEF